MLRPVRVHLLDGGTVIFRGATIGPTAITALSDSVPGRAFALLDSARTWRRSVPLDSVAALEVVEDEPPRRCQEFSGKL